LKLKLFAAFFCRFGVFGVGSQAYDSNFNAVARAFDTHLASLGGVRMVLRGEGDVDEATVDKEFDVWTKGLLEKLEGARLRPSSIEADENGKENGGEHKVIGAKNDIL
jgi:sulfite reductase alpha subunit-like flavoprotein